MDWEIDIKAVNIIGGLIYEKQKTVAEKSVPYIKRALNNEIPGIEPSGAFENFRAAAGLSEKEFYGLVSQDSDLFKWMEAASLALQFEKEKREEDPESGNIKEQIISDLEEAVGLLEKAQQKDGYLNSYYILNGLKDRWNYLKESCQLYCAGHLFEAAVSNYEVTGHTELLKIAEKYADCIERTFGTETGKIRGYDGHAEVEIGLYRLYKATGREKYKKLADYFVEERGQNPYFFQTEKRKRNMSENLVYELDEKDFRHSQSHLPIREQKEAVGHAVKAMYFYTAAAQKAGMDNDTELFEVLKILWNSVTKEKMYLTGAIGASEHGESFSFPFDLPPDLMYGETCASVGLFLFAYRMLLNETDSSYGDVMERTLYNGILAGMSESGTEFFYTNAIDVDPEKCEKRKDHMHISPGRKPWFECPCCPSNVARLILGMNRYIYTENTNVLNIHLYMPNVLETRQWRAEMKTSYPENGKVELNIWKKGSGGTVRARIPWWCTKRTYFMDGKQVFPRIENGYACFKIRGDKKTVLVIDMPMETVKVYADVRVRDLIGKAAIMRGPIVYCVEEKDNGDPACLFFRQNGKADWKKGKFYDQITAEGFRCISADNRLYTTELPRFEKTSVILIPYFQWNNRGKGRMKVFLNVMKAEIKQPDTLDGGLK